MTSETSESTPIVPTPTTSSQSSLSAELSPTNKSLDFDAPLLALINKFPRGFSNIEEGQKFVKELQTLRLVPTTLRSKLQEESNLLEKINPRPKRQKKVPQTADDILKGL
jgi:hypothetical protein